MIIYKYEVPVKLTQDRNHINLSYEQDFEISMQIGSVILTAEIEDRKISLWAMSPDKGNSVPFKFCLMTTGRVFDYEVDNLEYINTLSFHGMKAVFHLFRKKNG